MEQVHGAYVISDDPARLDCAAIHAYLTTSYWSPGIPLDLVRRAVAGSLCLGVYDGAGRQVGLARFISDHATYCYVCDVYVLEGHRGQGLAQAMMALALAHPRLQGLRSWNLRTRDAHGLYARFGFKPVTEPENSMVRRIPDGSRPAAGQSSPTSDQRHDQSHAASCRVAHAASAAATSSTTMPQPPGQD